MRRRRDGEQAGTRANTFRDPHDIPLTRRMTSLLAILALGFMLGMRHATDPDHVVAVTTIVTGQRSVRRAALVGAAWGLGHTFTILLVGSAIILFKWAVPPRLGL